MDSLPGVYEGRIVSKGDGNAVAFVPQIFGLTTIIVSDFLGEPEIGKGWVSFQAGDPEHPVWLSGSFSSDGSGGSGEQGPIGPVGPPGPVGIVSFIHDQSVVSATWDVIHNLGWYPNVTVVDSTGTTVEGDLLQISTNQLRLTFSGAFTGKAYLS